MSLPGWQLKHSASRLTPGCCQQTSASLGKGLEELQTPRFCAALCLYVPWPFRGPSRGPTVLGPECACDLGFSLQHQRLSGGWGNLRPLGHSITILSACPCVISEQWELQTRVRNHGHLICGHPCEQSVLSSHSCLCELNKYSPNPCLPRTPQHSFTSTGSLCCSRPVVQISCENRSRY